MTNGKDWGRAQTQQVANEIRRLRAANTVQWLADRTAEIGYPISRSRISDLERGDRGALLGAAELVVLAKALDVPPLQLLYPGVPGDEVEVIPEVTTLAIAAAQWFSGEMPFQYYLPNFDGTSRSLTYRGPDLEAQQIGGIRLQLARREVRAQETLEARVGRRSHYDREFAQAERDEDSARMAELRTSIDRSWSDIELALQSISAIRQMVIDEGATPLPQTELERQQRAALE